MANIWWINMSYFYICVSICKYRLKSKKKQRKKKTDESVHFQVKQQETGMVHYLATMVIMSEESVNTERSLKKTTQVWCTDIPVRGATHSQDDGAALWQILVYPPEAHLPGLENLLGQLNIRVYIPEAIYQLVNSRMQAALTPILVLKCNICAVQEKFKF